jgi:hypothetical protein
MVERTADFLLAARRMAIWLGEFISGTSLGGRKDAMTGAVRDLKQPSSLDAGGES